MPIAAPQAPALLPPLGPDGVTAGVDWSCKDHAVAVVDATGLSWPGSW